MLPVMTAEGAVGVLALNFDEPRTFDDTERGLLDALAKLFSQSLERAKLYEDARRREWAASLVARMSESLERATSVPERCRRAVAILAAELAGFAAVDLCEEDGTLHRIASSRRGGTANGHEAELAARALATGAPQSEAETVPARTAPRADPSRFHERGRLRRHPTLRDGLRRPRTLAGS